MELLLLFAYIFYFSSFILSEVKLLWYENDGQQDIWMCVFA